MEITYFGHATLGIKSGDNHLLVDPFLADNPACDTDPGTLSPNIIALTHAHGDHISDVLPMAKRTGCKVIGNYEIFVWLGENEIENASPANPGGTVQTKMGPIMFTQAVHSSSFPDGRYGGVACGHVYEFEGKRIYNTGDTCYFSDMSLVGSEIDLMILPIGDRFTMGLEGALDSIKAVRPKAVLPVHYNTYPPIAVTTEALDEWKTSVEGLGIKVHILRPGEAVTL